MRAPFALALAVAALAACRQAAPTVKLELADARLAIVTEAGATRTIALTAHGEVSFDGEVFATITRKGQILVGGKPTGQLDLDGALRVHGQLTNANVGPDGAFKLDGVEELALGQDGAATGPLLDTMDHPRIGAVSAMRYEGPATARRATMLGFAVFVTSVPSVPKPASTN